MSKRLDKAIFAGTWEKQLQEGKLGIIDIMSHYKQITDSFTLKQLIEIREQIATALPTEQNLIEKGALYDILAYVNECIIRRQR